MAVSFPKVTQPDFWNPRRTMRYCAAFKSGEELMAAACEYFDWCNKNPLVSEKVFFHKGVVTRAKTSNMRAFTISGLATFLGLHVDTILKWKNRPEGDEIGDATKMIYQIVETQKYEGAAANMLNPMLVVRDLGLTDKTMHSNDPDNPMPVAIFQLPDNGRG